MRAKFLILTALLVLACASQASALEYTIDAPGDYLFARPTSDNTIYEREETNVDRSKNAALIPPGFGTPTSYLPGSGTPLTPNLAPGNQVSNGNPTQWLSLEAEKQGSVWSFRRQAETEWSGLCDEAGGGLVTSTSAVHYPAVIPGVNGSSTGGSSVTVSQYTEVTSDLYYSGGHIGTLKIPAVGLSVKVYEGTDSATLKKGVGHFENTSFFTGNTCLAAHNRGVNDYFGDIHKLDCGDEITLQTKLGSRIYTVTSVEKVLETDTSGTAATADNCLTLYTCVRDQSAYRWCVRAVAD